MGRAGFVLVGGLSSRMGRDKALLPFGETTLVEHVARQVAEAAGSVTLVGRPERYRHLRFSLIPDEFADGGPLGGIHAALAAASAEWNLVIACDMPAVTGPFLRELLDEAETSGCECLAARSPGGLPEPLCAVYNLACRDSLAAWLASGRRKASDWLATRRVRWHDTCGDWLRNANTSEEWEEYLHPDSRPKSHE